jgi:hypothetical protein
VGVFLGLGGRTEFMDYLAFSLFLNILSPTMLLGFLSYSEHFTLQAAQGEGEGAKVLNNIYK